MIILIFLAIGIALSIVIYSYRTGISPMPTSPKAKRCLSDNLPMDLQSHGRIYELGSGWGTLVFALSKKYKNHVVIGIEMSPFPYWISKIAAFIFRRNNVLIVQGDFFERDLSDAALIVCYLYPGAMKRLKIKFDKELKSGTWVVSNTFSIPGWSPVMTCPTGDLYNTNVYFYRH